MQVKINKMLIDRPGFSHNQPRIRRKLLKVKFPLKEIFAFKLNPRSSA